MSIGCIRKDDERISYLKKKDERLGKLIDLVGEISYWKPDDYEVQLKISYFRNVVLRLVQE